MTTLLVRTYLKSHYHPTALLGMFFGTFTIAFIFIIPTFWLPGDTIIDSAIPWFLFDASVVCFFLMFAFLIMAFEGMKGQILSPISTLFIALTAVAISLHITVLTLEPTYSGNVGEKQWWGNVSEEFYILFVVFVLTAVIIVLFRLIQFIRYESPEREKKMTIIALTGFLATIIGGVGILLLEILNMDYLFVLIGTILLAIIYLKHPHSFFLSHTKINAIMVINTSNKIPMLIIGEHKKEEKGSSLALAAAGLGGITLLLQEILGSKRPPTRLYHKDKGILLHHDFKYGVSGVIVADQVNDVLRSPLKYALKQFAKRYETELADWVGEVGVFQSFEKDLRKIFKFALVEVTEPEVHQES